MLQEHNVWRNKRSREPRQRTPESMRWWLDEVRVTGDTRPLWFEVDNERP